MTLNIFENSSDPLTLRAKILTYTCKRVFMTSKGKQRVTLRAEAEDPANMFTREDRC